VLVLGSHDDLVSVPEAAKGDSETEQPDGPAPPASGGRRRAPRGLVTKLHTDDRELGVDVARKYREITKKATKATAPELGSFHQWAYFQFGVPSFEVDPFEVPEDAKPDKKTESAPETSPSTEPATRAAASESRPAPPPDEIIEDAARRIRNDGFVPWH